MLIEFHLVIYNKQQLCVKCSQSKRIRLLEQRNTASNRCWESFPLKFFFQAQEFLIFDLETNECDEERTRSSHEQ